jgi:hypothetical protein
MKYGELLDRLDSPIDEYFDSSALIEELGLDGWADLGLHGFTSRPITAWLCTDTIVGCTAVYMDGELVAIREQTARKNYVEWQWRTRDAYFLVHRRVHDLMEPQSEVAIDTIDLDDEIGEPVYQLNYGSQVLFNGLHSTAIYEGRQVKVLNATDRGHLCKRILITEDGKKTQTVSIKNLYFPIPLKP